MPKDDNEKIRRQVMKGIQDPSKHNPHHKANVKRDADKAKKVQQDLAKRKGKHTRRKGDDGVIDSGMFS